MSVYAELLALFARRGDEHYGESLTQEEHMLLTAGAARRAGLRPALVAAALLHDVGHLLVDPDDWSGVHGHASIGGDWVEARLGAEIAQPVRLHVDAKRCLCAVDPAYLPRLSDPSRHTLAKQGGPLDAEERRAFERTPGSRDALVLRRLEDGLGKESAATPPEYASFRELLGALEDARASSS